METMVKDRKLRLLVTTDCPNHCPMCCNNSWDFDKLPVVKDFDYDEVMIIGGEPLLFTDKVIGLAKAIKTLNPILYPGESVPKIYVYTSMPSIYRLSKVMEVVDGIVLTPHSKKDVGKFIKLNTVLLNDLVFIVKVGVGKFSLRLNLFKNIKDMLPEDIDLSLWKVKDIEWIKDCPVPQGEAFRRLPHLWPES